MDMYLSILHKSLQADGDFWNYTLRSEWQSTKFCFNLNIFKDLFYFEAKDNLIGH